MNAITKHESGHLAMSEDELLPVLQSSLYPGANLNSIRMVLGYCRAAGLDPMQKPVHIVPMWDSKAGQMRDVVMPGVNLYRTQASRSGQFAGMSEPEFGPDCTDNIGGQTITYPEWCRVSVKRLLGNGSVAEFTAREFWIENYATKGGKEKSIAPNAMWTKRPRGQIAKCAAAQALRIAFPEIASQPTADEMEGKPLNFDNEGAAIVPDPKRVDLQAWIAKARATEDDAAAAAVWAEGGKAIAATKNKADYIAFRDAVAAHRTALKDMADALRTVDVQAAEVDPFVADMEAAEGTAP
jgi:phage recombination protein Bet